MARSATTASRAVAAREVGGIGWTPDFSGGQAVSTRGLSSEDSTGMSRSDCSASARTVGDAGQAGDQASGGQRHGERHHRHGHRDRQPVPGGQPADGEPEQPGRHRRRGRRGHTLQDGVSGGATGDEGSVAGIGPRQREGVAEGGGQRDQGTGQRGEQGGERGLGDRSATPDAAPLRGSRSACRSAAHAPRPQPRARRPRPARATSPPTAATQQPAPKPPPTPPTQRPRRKQRPPQQRHQAPAA